MFDFKCVDCPHYNYLEGGCTVPEDISSEELDTYCSLVREHYEE